MDLRFSEEQRALADMARDLFGEVNDAGRLRAVWEADGQREDRWDRLAGVGLTGVGLPPADGGSGGGLVDLILVCEAAGETALAEPLVEAVAVAAPLLAGAGTDSQRDRWLAPLADGSARVLARLAGQPHVVDADRADLLLLEDDDRGLVVADPDEADLRRVASEDRARRLFAAGAAGAGRLVEGAGPHLDRARQRARAATAAVLNGVSRRLVEMGVAHARDREQFGRPVGSFQAVSHRLADLHVAVDSVRAAAWHAAWAIDRRQPDAATSARVAKAAAAEAHAEVNTGVLQVHGGIGFTWEHDLHLWLKRGKALQPLHGTAREHRRALAAGLLDEPADATARAPT